jgi:peptide/nickel transport system permease protein
MVSFFALLAISAEYISPYGPFDISSDVLRPASAAHFFGTDHLGRDIFSRIVYGARISLIFGFLAAGISMIAGIILGAIPGYYGGSVDDLFSRSIEVFLTIPTLILIILVMIMVSTDISFAILVVGLTMWPSNAKITRAQVLSLKTREYALACRGLGGSDMRVLFMHIVPNGLYPIISNSFVQMAYAILTEASLSFLGLGDMKRVSWGLMIYDARAQVFSAPWVAVIPGIAITLLVVGLNLVGDGINFALNPKMKLREA